MNKTDLNDLVTCKCGIVLEETKIMHIKETNPDTPREWELICPLCKHKVTKTIYD